MDDLDKVFESVADYFGLLADPTRLKILHCLCTQERSVNDVVASLGLTQGNTSRHLNLLYRAGVLGRRKEGSQVFYTLVDPHFVDICRSVCVAVVSRTDSTAPKSQDVMRFQGELEAGLTAQWPPKVALPEKETALTLPE